MDPVDVKLEQLSFETIREYLKRHTLTTQQYNEINTICQTKSKQQNKKMWLCFLRKILKKDYSEIIQKAIKRDHKPNDLGDFRNKKSARRHDFDYNDFDPNDYYVDEVEEEEDAKEEGSISDDDFSAGLCDKEAQKRWEAQQIAAYFQDDEDDYDDYDDYDESEDEEEGYGDEDKDEEEEEDDKNKANIESSLKKRKGRGSNFEDSSQGIPAKTQKTASPQQVITTEVKAFLDNLKALDVFEENRKNGHTPVYYYVVQLKHTMTKKVFHLVFEHVEDYGDPYDKYLLFIDGKNLSPFSMQDLLFMEQIPEFSKTSSCVFRHVVSDIFKQLFPSTHVQGWD